MTRDIWTALFESVDPAQRHISLRDVLCGIVDAHAVWDDVLEDARMVAEMVDRLRRERWQAGM